jgi:hypothetical protein
MLGAVHHGLAGEIVAAIGPHSEADPAALLIQFLVAFGSCIGRAAHWVVGGDYHYGNLFAVLVGRSAKGRKGTSWGEIRRLFDGIGDWLKERVVTGASSAEGIIYAIRDPVFGPHTDKGDQTCIDQGVSDKRLLLIEAEFSTVLKQAERMGNTLSPLVRQAWEQGDLRTLTRNSPLRATGAHISILGHITQQELLRYLSATESANGFANRFLWLAVKRSQILPFGGSLDDATLTNLRGRLAIAVEFASALRLMERDAQANEMWKSIYPSLTAEGDGLAAAVCGRAEAQTMRLAMLYALLDCSDVIRLEHLEAGYALWEYCENSARYIFGDALGDQLADEIDVALRNNLAGLTRTQIRDLFGRNKPASDIGRALGVLAGAGRAVLRSHDSGGRPVERWFSTVTLTTKTT